VLVGVCWLAKVDEQGLTELDATSKPNKVSAGPDATHTGIQTVTSCMHRVWPHRAWLRYANLAGLVHASKRTLYVPLRVLYKPSQTLRPYGSSSARPVASTPTSSVYLEGRSYPASKVVFGFKI
jgi:hypothetical protein